MFSELEAANQRRTWFEEVKETLVDYQKEIWRHLRQDLCLLGGSGRWLLCQPRLESRMAQRRVLRRNNRSESARQQERGFSESAWGQVWGQDDVVLSELPLPRSFGGPGQPLPQLRRAGRGFCPLILRRELLSSRLFLFKIFPSHELWIRSYKNNNYC